MGNTAKNISKRIKKTRSRQRVRYATKAALRVGEETGGSNEYRIPRR